MRELFYIQDKQRVSKKVPHHIYIKILLLNTRKFYSSVDKLSLSSITYLLCPIYTCTGSYS